MNIGVAPRIFFISICKFDERDHIFTEAANSAIKVSNLKIKR